eukprot:CAMPEP_0197079140 /NCGR_PEP_ID=MMETSP1384-20130603/213471_1 /TAXON_ID=29189 /ORGANISM="Ammonia sp." /LENGTH=985 /DNA_ID=CAMNT_0042518013 /DNA_START=29 /DNA_END=2986 /DNA_ORIENTATION=+
MSSPGKIKTPELTEKLSPAINTNDVLHQFPPHVVADAGNADLENGDNTATNNGAGDAPSAPPQSSEAEATESAMYRMQQSEAFKKTKAFCTDPLKMALTIALLALFITILSASIIGGTLKARIAALETNPSAYGIVNVNETYQPGGYYGWAYYDSYPDLYPLKDLHVHVGDRVFFTAKTGTWEDLWLVPREVYESCNFTNETSQIQLAIAKWIRGDTYTRNESCTLGSDGCSERGWILREYPYNDDGGFTFLVQDWHVAEWGNPLYFASAREWDNWNDLRYHGCLNGIKLRVFVDERKAIPLVEDDGSSYDLQALQTVDDLSESIGHLSRMLMLQQFNFEQRIRSQGDSGLTNVRGSYDGDEAYSDGTYTNGAVASIHNHADNYLLVGIGEIQAVLNGVEFQTRHNDYNLQMPSTSSSKYGETEQVEYPEVPPEVSSKNTVEKQIEEMQEWFRAFKDQNKTHRNYTRYFKPILCYLEGTWVLDDNTLNEPFESDRHFIDARSWAQLHDKLRWFTNSGRKNLLENLAHLPSSVRNLVNGSLPIVSNWEYRIVCHPLKNDVPTSRFRIVDDLAVQLLSSPETRDELTYSRRARFELNKYINLDNIDDDTQWTNGRKTWNYLDYLMEQVVGKDNYGADLRDSLPDGSQTALHYITEEPLNSAYYSRFYRLNVSDAMGTTGHRRGFSDRYLFAAQTTQSKVSPIEIQYEQTNEDGTVEYLHTESRYSYAIPFEIIYLTPITKWNPYGVQYYNKDEYDYTKTGGCTKSTAYSGWTERAAYFTPMSFFQGLTQASAGDTVTDNTCALGADGEVYPVMASGHWINFPDIGGNVGIVRQRYPIFPIHAAGSTTFKEVKALQAVTLPSDYDDAEAYPDGFFGDSRDLIYGFEVSLQGGGHQHVVYIQGWRIRVFWYDGDTESWLMSADNVVTVEGDTRNNHAHTLEVWRDLDADGGWQYHVKRCRWGSISDADKYSDEDWMDGQCEDHHNAIVR